MATKIDLTPTWSQTLRMVLFGYDTAQGEGREVFRKELVKMATLADQWNGVLRAMEPRWKELSDVLKAAAQLSAPDMEPQAQIHNSLLRAGLAMSTQDHHLLDKLNEEVKGITENADRFALVRGEYHKLGISTHLYNAMETAREAL